MLTRVSQRGNTQIKVHSPSGVIERSPIDQTLWIEQQLATDEKTDFHAALVQLVRTVNEIYVETQEVYNRTKKV